jgi:Mannosyl-glycoprotein endo-beta-N-acetylglucosaminidase/LysM domain
MKRIFIIGFLFTAFSVNAQRITPEEYIETFKEAAVAEMKRSGVPASITLSQGLLETENGNSELVKKSNNHFGIKCKSDWTGESVRHTDDAPNECFRKYPSAAESYKDHSDYLKSSERYASLFQLPTSDYKGWALGLKRAGYATNPRYAQIVISNIEKYNLQLFDEAGYDINSASSIVTDTTKRITTEAKIIPVDADLVAELKTKTKFNGLKALFASRGISLIAIATAANIDLSKLLEYNDLQKDGLLKEDQLIYLERKNKQGNRDIYTCLQNETLHDISQNNGIQLKALAQLNGMRETEQIKKGTKIKLR